MIQVRSSYVPLKRKTNNFWQWTMYIESKLREVRGYDKHKFKL